MSNERVILCGGLTAPDSEAKEKTVRLQLAGKDPNVTLKISDISKKMVSNIPPMLVDLLEVATYIYCADQATTRGGNGVKDYGAKWRRQFHFHIPVREPKLWSSEAVLTALRDGLGFLSDDEYEFNFKKWQPRLLLLHIWNLRRKPDSKRRRSSCFREVSIRSEVLSKRPLSQRGRLHL